MKIRSLWKLRLGACLAAAWISQAATAVPLVTGTLTPLAGTVGGSVALSVSVTGAVDLYAFQLSVAFNPAQLAVASVTEGSFLPSAGSTFFGGGTVDNTAGTLSLSFDSLLGGVSGKSGSGVLETIVFNVVGAGAGTLRYGDLLFLDSTFNDLGAQATPTAITTAVPEPANAALLVAGLAALASARRRSRRCVGAAAVSA